MYVVLEFVALQYVILNCCFWIDSPTWQHNKTFIVIFVFVGNDAPSVLKIVFLHTLETVAYY